MRCALCSTTGTLAKEPHILPASLPSSLQEGICCVATPEAPEYPGARQGMRGPLLNDLFHRTGAFVKDLAYLPLAEDIPIAFNSCRKGPRSLGWRSDRPAELTWIECQVRIALLT